MMFKLSAVVLAAAALVAASPVERRGIADCTYVVTPSGVPDTSSTPLFSEWNYLIGRNFAGNFPDTIIDGSSSTVTGPDAVTGAYTVVKSVGTAAITDAEAVAIVTGWVGTTFDGPWSGVKWHIDSVVC